MGGICSCDSCEDDSKLPFVDFDNCQPSESESSLYNEVSSVLSHSSEVLRCLEEYRGCQELARKAMSSPSLENEQEAFEGLLIAVSSISTFYHYAKDLERILPNLLEALAQGSSDQIPATFQEKQSLVKQLGLLFDFSLRFDSTRMLRPSISNDFSYYRRLLPKFNKHPGIQVRDDDASGMALFTAEHIPMMSVMSKSTSSASDRNPNITHVLAILANASLKMLKTKRFIATPATTLFVARCMTGSIVLYDHVDLLGVFGNKSPVQLRGCVSLLKKDFPLETGLLNAIHYSTKHFKDASPTTQALFD